jgi:hypothetical protein
MSSGTMPGGLWIIRKRPPIAVTPKLKALSGGVFFACALVAMLRIMVLNANHKLHFPGLDFAVCSVVATLGLRIARIASNRE